MLRIRLLRKQKGLSQREIEERLRIPHVTYSLLEMGRLTRPTNSVQASIENFFGHSVKYLLSEAPKRLNHQMEKLEKLSLIDKTRKAGTLLFLRKGRDYMRQIGKKGGLSHARKRAKGKSSS